MSFRVLILEDDAGFRKILDIKLKSFLPQVDVVSLDSITKVREYLKTVKNPDFDLVILDQHLPDGRSNELLAEGWFQDLAVLSISSDDSPNIPGQSIEAGASFFLAKASVSQPAFEPLVRGLVERNRLQRELTKLKLNQAVMESVRTLVSTLRHEINNPLGAVLGAAYILRNNAQATKEQIEAAELVESSGKRINHVLTQLCDAMELEPVTKANQKVFHIPGDKPWE